MCSTRSEHKQSMCMHSWLFLTEIHFRDSKKVMALLSPCSSSSVKDCVHMRKTHVTNCSDVTHWCVFNTVGVISVKVINEEKTNTEGLLQDVSKTGWPDKCLPKKQPVQCGNILWTNETTINLNFLKTFPQNKQEIKAATVRAWQRIIRFYGFQILDSQWPKRISHQLLKLFNLQLC